MEKSKESGIRTQHQQSQELKMNDTTGAWDRFKRLASRAYGAITPPQEVSRVGSELPIRTMRNPEAVLARAQEKPQWQVLKEQQQREEGRHEAFYGKSSAQSLASASHAASYKGGVVVSSANMRDEYVSQRDWQKTRDTYKHRDKGMER